MRKVKLSFMFSPRVEVAGGQGQALPLEQPAGAGLALDRFLHAGDALHLGGVQLGLSGVGGVSASVLPPSLARPIPSRPIPASRRSLVGISSPDCSLYCCHGTCFTHQVCAGFARAWARRSNTARRALLAERAQRRSGTRAGKAKK